MPLNYTGKLYAVNRPEGREHQRAAACRPPGGWSAREDVNLNPTAN